MMKKLFGLMVAAGFLYSILLMGAFYAFRNGPERHPDEYVYTVDECVDACVYAYRDCECW